MAAECNDSTCTWRCTLPGGCVGEDGWELVSFGCTGDPGCGCAQISEVGGFDAYVETLCELSGLADDQVCDGSCPPDDWRNTADIDPWAPPTSPPPTTTTTTSYEPCTGNCLWTYDQDTKEYTLVKSACSEGCDCYYPNFCAPDGCEIVYTDCVRGAPPDHGTPPNCTGTTTTTTTPPGCTGSCTWKYYPVLGWIRTSDNPCSGSCPCPAPTGSAGAPYSNAHRFLGVHAAILELSAAPTFPILNLPQNTLVRM